jgi:hypothetical protein
VGEAIRARQQARVGDGVGGAREEIGEPENGPDLRRENGQREVEGPADPLEELAGEIRP